MFARYALFAMISICIATVPSLADGGGLLEAADIEEHLGARIPNDIELQDESGKTTTTGELFDGDRPVLLVLAYYRCPMLCPLVLTGASKGLSDAGFVMGNDYRLVTVSIDPDDTPADARSRKASLRAKVGADVETGARFLVGTAEATHAIADAVGFRYAYDSSTAQYAHPALVTVLGPGSRISRYIYGVEPPVRDLRFALLEAAEGKIGSIVDRIVVTCYRFDPATRRYGPYIAGFFRVGAIVILGAVGSILGLLWRHDRRRNTERNSP
jgi:protein SCO1